MLGFEKKLGAISSAFGLDKPKFKPIYVDKRLQQFQDSLTNTLPGLRSLNQADLGNYETAFRSATPEYNRLAGDDIGAISRMLRSMEGYDPLNYYAGALDIGLGRLGNLANQIADYGSAADKLSLAARGFGGRASDGGYGTILRTNQISRNFVPSINTIYNLAGSVAANANENRFRNLLGQLGLMDTRLARVNAPANRLLEPISTRMGNLGGEIEMLAQMIANSKANTAGMQQETSNWDRFLRGIGASADELGGTAAQLAMSYMGMLGGGGGMGGLLGGMGGGMGGGLFGSGMGGGMGGAGGIPPWLIYSMAPWQNAAYPQGWGPRPMPSVPSGFFAPPISSYPSSTGGFGL